MTHLLHLRPRMTLAVLCAGLLLLCTANADEAADTTVVTEAADSPPQRLILTESTTLDPGIVYGGIVIQRSGITVDGRGATISGPVLRAGGPEKDYTGVGISARGVSDVTLRNVCVRGWETGLQISDGSGWLIEDCDFSDNFSDPAFGWGENGRRGGLVLSEVDDSVLLRNRACRVWDGCVLVDCDRNLLEGNQFSHCSNTCLKLWHSGANRIRRNQLSHGIRKDPGEVHARDSTCVLIESGSDGNRFLENDCTYGGDGIFVRVLNGWQSTGNYFEGNDCSFANNNGVECWAPGNTFVGNRANHCSYGFWLGGSDGTKLIGNEASFNGLPDGNHNSPHLPDSGHAGIVFMFGTSTHTLVRENRLEGNHGAGVALIGDLGSQGRNWRAAHWVLEQNALIRNRWGIYGQHADWIVLTSNQYQENQLSEVEWGDDVRYVERNDQQAKAMRQDQGFRLRGPSRLAPGESARWQVEDLSTASLTTEGISWRIDNGVPVPDSEISTAGLEPGFHQLSVNVNRAGQTHLLWHDLYVVRRVSELGTEAEDAEWSVQDFAERQPLAEQISVIAPKLVTQSAICGERSLQVRITPYSGQRVVLLTDVQQAISRPTAELQTCSFWLKARNSDQTGWQGGPFLLLEGSGGKRCWVEPAEGKDLMREVEHPEQKLGWRLVQIPLAGGGKWRTHGELPAGLERIGVGFDSWGAPPLEIEIDGLTIE